ncbi:MAG: hypothetical protein GC182_14840 [Rhodopseudomonas sp.]|nr:hypothetical protein [Rhodopseudomonas sp.]
MVKVPEYAPTERLRPAFRQGIQVNATPEAFGADIGRGMQKAAAGLGDLSASINHVQELTDETKAREARNAFMKGKDELYYGDNGYSRKDGSAAIDGFDDYRKGLDDLKRNYSKDLTPNQMRLFDKAVAPLEIDATRAALIHKGTALKKYAVDQATNGADNFKTQAVQSFGDQATWTKYTTAGLAELHGLGEKLGWAPEKLKSEQQAYLSDTHRLTALEMANEDPISALEYISKNKDQLTPTDHLNLMNSLMTKVAPAVARDAISARESKNSDTAKKTVGDSGTSDVRGFLLKRLTNGHDASHVDGLDAGFGSSLAAMIQAAPENIRDGLGLLSGFRSVERQRQLWEGSDKSGKWVAPPGRSYHNHGEAADLAYNGKSLSHAPQDVVDWVHANAGKFGLYFPMAHEPWHVEPMGTRGGSKSSSGTISGVPLSPRVEKLLSELPANYATRIREVAASGIAQAETQEAAQFKARRLATVDDYKLRIAQEDATLTRQQILDDQTLDNGDKAALLGSYASKFSDALETRHAIGAFQAGQFAIDPYSSGGKKLVDNVWGALSSSVDKDHVSATLDNLVRQSGSVPQPVINAIRGDLASQSVSAVANSAQLAARLYAIDPAALERRDGGKQVRDTAVMFSHLTNKVGMSPAAAAQNIIAARDPEKARERVALMQSDPVKKFVKDQATESNVRDIFDPGLFSFDPKLGETPMQSAAMVADYRDMLEESLYDAAGNQDTAKALATDRFKRRYGVSDFAIAGRGIVSRLPPEVTYPAGIDGTHGYIRDQLKTELAAAGVKSKEVYLKADLLTDQDFSAGKMPRYEVWYRDSKGILDRFRLPFSAVPPSREEVVAARKAKAERNRDRNMRFEEMTNERAMRQLPLGVDLREQP